MKNWIKTTAAAAAACFLFAACSSGGEDITVDVGALAEALNTGITYQDPLEKLDDGMVGMLYDVDGLVTESVV